MVLCLDQREQQTAPTAGWGAAEAGAFRETDGGVWTHKDWAGEDKGLCSNILQSGALWDSDAGRYLYVHVISRSF